MRMNESLRTAPVSHPAHFPTSLESMSNALNGIPPAKIACLSPAKSVGFKEISDIRDRKFFSFGKWPCKKGRR
jgi:hypothetical protein